MITHWMEEKVSPCRPAILSAKMLTKHYFLFVSVCIYIYAEYTKHDKKIVITSYRGGTKKPPKSKRM